MTTIKDLVVLVRPHQYIKNAFVFIGVVFSGHWDSATIGSALLSFVAFCAIASSVYVFNDIRDVDVDRKHPTKRRRPIASGAVSISLAAWLSGVLALIALSISSMVGVWVVLFVLLYALLNAGYSLGWKHIAVLDVFIISAGFMLRILSGTVGIGIAPSSWLLLCGLMLTLFLGFAKRRAELLLVEQLKAADQRSTRRVLGDYSPAMIEQFIAITAACTILSYGLYTVSEETLARHGTGALIYTVPFVVYGIFRYLFLLHQKAKGNDISRDLISDPHLILTVSAWFVTTVGILM